MTAETLFISDCHLSAEQPEITQHFISFIKTRATKARVLYILGDLFELWLGDDDEAENLSSVLDVLHSLSKTTQIYFLAGNRDFLVGQNLAKQVGFKLINEPHIITLNQQKTALIHGDTLCTDDVDYQNFRQLVRSQAWQQEFLAKPLSERQAIAKQLRENSKQAMQGKQEQIMDVNQNAVLEFTKQHNITQLIHGHTHRPAIHYYPEQRLTRYVLGDWRPKASYLRLNNKQITLCDSRVKPK